MKDSALVSPHLDTLFSYRPLTTRGILRPWRVSREGTVQTGEEEAQGKPFHSLQQSEGRLW